MKVSPEARRLAKYKEKKKEISVATLQFDVTFCTPILCAPSYGLSLSQQSLLAQLRCGILPLRIEMDRPMKEKLKLRGYAFCV